MSGKGNELRRPEELVHLYERLLMKNEARRAWGGFRDARPRQQAVAALLGYSA
jgi:hypothetical protein